MEAILSWILKSKRAVSSCDCLLSGMLQWDSMSSTRKDKKVTNGLAQRASSSVSKKDVLEIIVELSPLPSVIHRRVSSPPSRTELIAERKESFARTSTPVEDAIVRAGGIVTGKAWINRTLKARVPVESIKRISELDEVESLDTPHDLDPDVTK